jgi:tetratricopeptide (TPR) repeat protein
MLGLVYALAGRVSEARKLLDELIGLARVSYVSPAYLGWIHVGLGESDRAFECFEKAIEDHSYVTLFLGVDPLYDPIRSDPRYHALLRKMNLEP